MDLVAHAVSRVRRGEPPGRRDVRSVQGALRPPGAPVPGGVGAGAAVAGGAGAGGGRRAVRWGPDVRQRPADVAPGAGVRRRAPDLACGGGGSAAAVTGGTGARRASDAIGALAG